MDALVRWAARIDGFFKGLVGLNRPTVTYAAPLMPEDSDVERCRADWRGISLPSKAHADLIGRHRVLILSEDEAVAFKPPQPEETVLVRILNPAHAFRPLEGTYASVIEAKFHDLETGASDEDTIACGAYRQIEREAIRIVPFLAGHLEKTVVVHCHRGMARSAAVALFALELRGDTTGVEHINSCSNEWAPNPWVLRALRRTS